VTVSLPRAWCSLIKFEHQLFVLQLLNALVMFDYMRRQTLALKAATMPLLLLISMQLPTMAQTSNSHKPLSGRYLYVAVPGIRDYMGYGGHGLLVFDMDHNHRLVKRIVTGGLHPNGKPSNVKGIAVSVPLNSIYISTIESLQRIDLGTGEIIWEKFIDKGCDRMAISPDGKLMYLPSFEKDIWNVVNCKTGEIIKKITGFKRSHNTVYGLSGKHVYLDDIGSPWLTVADTKTHTVGGRVGPFGNFIRPFAINGRETRSYVTVDSLLGFEVGDLQTGKKLARVVVEGWEAGPVRRHGNPSHGIGLTPDEKELWLCDGHNMRLHVFSAAAPYQQLTTISLQDMPGWITFSLDGKTAYPSSGEVIDVKTRKILLMLKDEFNNSVASEKMVEVDMENGKAIRAGDQFGLGRVR
jgi:DNA-binding beta-propeller fold protein YncE